MHTDGRTFKATPDAVAPAQSFCGRALPGAFPNGLMMGRNRETRRRVVLDATGMRQSQYDYLNGLYTLVDGERGVGKSTFQKSMIIRSGGLQAGVDEDENPRTYSLEVYESRNEAGEPEYSEVTKAMGGVTISPIQQNIKINPYDPAMNDERTMLMSSVDLAENIHGGPLGGMGPFLHQLAVSKMVCMFPGVGSPSLYTQILATLTTDDSAKYFRENASALQQQFKDAATTNPTLAAELDKLIKTQANLHEEDFAREVTKQASIMSQLTGGEYGVLFGDGTSFSDILALPYKSFDRLGMSPKLRRMFDAQLWRWQNWAITHNRTDLIPDGSFGDEDQDNYKSLGYLRAFDEYIRKLRSVPTWVWRATQYSERLTASGDESSEIRELAKTIDLGVSIRCIFRQPDNDAILHKLTQLGFSDEDAKGTTVYPRGCYALVVGKLPPIFVEHYLTEPEKRYTKTNVINDKIVGQRRNAREFTPRDSTDQGLQVLGEAGEFVEV